MIATAQTMLGPDPALPSRDALFDGISLRRVLEARLTGVHPAISDTRLVRVNYQVGKSLRALFRVTVGDTEHIVAARVFREGRSLSAYLRSRRQVLECGGPLPGVAHAPDLNCVLWVFPNDRKLDTLQPMLDSEVPSRIAAGAAVRNRLVAYAPEKSATFVCEDLETRPLAYAKVAAGEQAARDARTYHDLRATLREGDQRLRLPRPLTYDAARRTLWLEAIPGRRTAEAGSDRETSEDLAHLAMAVAAFHQLRAPEAPVFDRFAPTHLASDAALVGSVRPDVRIAAAHLAERLARTAPGEPDLISCLHGDLHPKNAIVSGDRIALVDVEDVATGPAAADVGSVLASMLYLHVCGRMSRERYVRSAATFLDGYTSAAHTRLSPDAAAWHAAAALFVERAARAVTRMRPLGLHHLGELLAEAERMLDRGLDL